MKRFLAAFAFALALGTVAAAQTAPAPWTLTFTAVDAVKVDYGSLEITGVLEGEAAPVTRRVSFSTSSSLMPLESRQSCERLALAAMAKPGAYLFVLQSPEPGNYQPSCTLRRAIP
jgi:hypothetical protein